MKIDIGTSVFALAEKSFTKHGSDYEKTVDDLLKKINGHKDSTAMLTHLAKKGAMKLISDLAHTQRSQVKYSGFPTPKKGRAPVGIEGVFRSTQSLLQLWKIEGKSLADHMFLEITSLCNEESGQIKGHQNNLSAYQWLLTQQKKHPDDTLVGAVVSSRAFEKKWKSITK